VWPEPHANALLLCGYDPLNYIIVSFGADALLIDIVEHIVIDIYLDVAIMQLC
jgi:hypothetical protein